MIKQFIGALAFAVGLLPLVGNTAQTATAKLTVTVTVTLPTCTVAVPASVDMGVVSNQDFSGVGTTANSKDFRLELSGCSGGVDGATVTFSGAAAASDALSFALDSGSDPAKGVGLQIKDDKGVILPPNQNSTTYVIDTSNPDIELLFKASLIQTENRIEAGTADTSVTVSIAYS